MRSERRVVIRAINHTVKNAFVKWLVIWITGREFNKHARRSQIHNRRMRAFTQKYGKATK